MSGCGWFPMSYRQIVDWIERHPDAMPRTLEDISRFPVAFRRVMINRVAPEVRLRLWQEHLESFLRPEAGLSDVQRQAIVTAIAEMPNVFAAGPAPNPVMTDFEKRMMAVFSRPEGGRIFAMIGPAEPPEGLPLPPDALPSTSQ
jgi:hypothetical protein